MIVRNHRDKDPLLSELLSIPIDQRLDTVLTDVSSRSDRYAAMDPHSLAESLGVPQPWNPAGGWDYIRYYPWPTFDQWCEDADLDRATQLDYFTACFNADRLQHLTKQNMADKEPHVAHRFLGTSAVEEECIRRMIENREWISEVELANCSEGNPVIARYELKTASGEALRFEGEIEDDGACIFLRTPYDDRDGRFVDLTDSATDEWTT